MLFMDHLSADLLCKDLPGDREGLQVINIYIGFYNNRETNHIMNTHFYVYVSPSRSKLLCDGQIKLLLAVNYTIYWFI